MYKSILSAFHVRRIGEIVSRDDFEAGNCFTRFFRLFFLYLQNYRSLGRSSITDFQCLHYVIDRRTCGKSHRCQLFFSVCSGIKRKASRTRRSLSGSPLRRSPTWRSSPSTTSRSNPLERYQTCWFVRSSLPTKYSGHQQFKRRPWTHAPRESHAA